MAGPVLPFEPQCRLSGLVSLLWTQHLHSQAMVVSPAVETVKALTGTNVLVSRHGPAGWEACVCCVVQVGIQVI